MSITIDNKYTLLRLIGEGGFSKVFTAIDDASHIVAIKVYSTKTTPKMLDTEISIIKTLHQHNYLKFYSANTIGCLRHNEKFKPIRYIALEHYPKHELTKYLESHPLPEKIAKSILRSLLLEVSMLHKLQICHRDIKCANISLDSEFKPHLLDFGFSTQGSSIMYDSCGSHGYLAPEIIYHKAYDGYKADIYALGILFYALCYKFIPNLNPTQNPKACKILQTSPSIYWQLLEKQTGISMSQEFQCIFLNMVNADPDLRPSVDELLSNQYFTSCLAEEKDIRELLHSRSGGIEVCDKDIVPSAMFGEESSII